MGQCGSASAAGASLKPGLHSTDSALAGIDLSNLCASKLVLLGASDSGKSTLFRQFQSLYTRGFTNAEREHYRRIVHHNSVACMQVLCKNTLVHGRTLSNELRSTAKVYVQRQAANNNPNISNSSGSNNYGDDATDTSLTSLNNTNNSYNSHSTALVSADGPGGPLSDIYAFRPRGAASAQILAYARHALVTPP